MKPTLDSDGLPTTSDRERYRDVIWRLSTDPDDCEAIVLDQLADDRAAFAAQTSRGRDLPVEGRSRFRLDTWHALCRGTDWPHVPLASDLGDALGTAVHDDLPAEITAALAPAGERAVRVKIVCSGKGHADVPWELMRGPHGPLVLDGVHVVRDLPVRFPAPATQIASQLRVAIVVGGPSAKEQLAIPLELGTVTPRHDWYKVEVSVGEPAKVVARRLRDFEPHVVHFVGHAAASQREGFVILADEHDAPTWMNAAALAAMLPPSVRLVCLDTCAGTRNYDVRGLGWLAQAPATLPTMIANLYAVTPDGAAAFWAGFYEQFADDRNVVEAVRAGRRRARERVAATADWGSYALHLRGGAAVLFESAPPSPGRDEGRDYAAHYMLRLANQLAAASTWLPPDAAERLLAESRAIAHDYVALAADAAAPVEVPPADQDSTAPVMVPLLPPLEETLLATEAPFRVPVATPPPTPELRRRTPTASRPIDVSAPPTTMVLSQRHSPLPAVSERVQRRKKSSPPYHASAMSGESGQHALPERFDGELALGASPLPDPPAAELGPRAPEPVPQPPPAVLSVAATRPRPVSYLAAIADPPDEDLISQYQHGQDAALTRLVDRHEKPLGRFVLRRIGEPAAADSLTKVALHHVAWNASAKRLRSTKFKPWLYSIAFNICARATRGRRFHDTVAIDADDTGPYAIVVRGPQPSLDGELQRKIERAILELPESQRDVFLLCDYDGLSFTEIASMSGAREDDVKVRLRAALRKLHRDLDPLEGVCVDLNYKDAKR